MNKIKQHLKNNKVTYIACGVTAVVVAGVTYYVTKDGKLASKAMTATTEYVGDTVIHNVAAINGVSWKPTVNVINFVENSTPSKRIGLLGKDGGIAQAFSSIGEAARSTGLDKSVISKIINGLREEADGMKFVELADAA